MLKEIGDSKASGDFTVFVDFEFKNKYETYYSSIEKVPGCGFKVCFVSSCTCLCFSTQDQSLNLKHGQAILDL